MVQLSSIYTRGGDGGKTSLGNGQRLLKSDLRLRLMGDIDEANACIGVAYTHSLNDKDGIAQELQAIQHDLFDLGADLCMPDVEATCLRIQASHVARLEAALDHINKDLPPLKSFVLPGGTVVGAYLHLARTVVRRAERTMVDFMQETPLNLEGLKYLNRLSDFLFVLSRFANGTGEILWQPGHNLAPKV